MCTTTERMLRELASRGRGGIRTPTYIIDQTTLEDNIDALYRAFRSRFKSFIFGYSYKTNYATDILRTVHRKGGYAEIVSPLELRHALSLVSGEKVIYNGVIPDTESKYKLAKSGGMVNIENMTELRAIDQLAHTEGSVVEVGVRVNLELVGRAPSRFGIEMTDEATAEILNLNNVRVVGIHSHVTKGRDICFWREKAEQMASIAKRIGATRYLDFGGNMFGRMHPDLAAQFHCHLPTFQEYADNIHDVLARHFQSDDMPTVIVEPGTPIIANAQSLLTSVVDIKTICGRTICTVDAKRLDMTVIGESGKQEPYSVLNFGEGQVQYAGIYGCTCLETDYFLKSYTGPLNVGDMILFDNIGSYSNSTAPRFIQGVPGIMRYDSSGFTEVKRPDSYEAMFQEYL